MTRKIFQCPADVALALRDYCQRTGASEAEVIRRAIIAFTAAKKEKPQ